MTIGHSTLSIEAFLRALQDNGVELLVDVRRYPGSRRNPQFAQPALFRFLQEAGLRAVWREGLGGHRMPQPGSQNTGWRHDSFRGYADYMLTEAFARELDWLTSLPQLDRTVVMCAEGLPWNCHRSLIADEVLTRGLTVNDLFVKSDGASECKPHLLTPFAKVIEGRLIYPGEPVLFS